MKFNSSRGAVSRLLLFLAIAILVVIIIIFVILKITGGKPSNQTKNDTPITDSQNPPPPPPLVLEATLNNVKFIMQDARDLGSVLTARNSYEQSVKTTEKFIQVTIGAQNVGKTNLPQYAWDLGDIIDSEGRHFIPSQSAYFFIPKPDTCGAILKPSFKPVPCIKIYEVSRLSKDLKIEIKSTDPKMASGLLDLE